MNRRRFLQSTGAAIAGSGALAAPARRPNILFILADQWRPQSLPSAGDADLHAPNLARLAAEGVQFNRMYTSNPVCTPSRAAVITGRYPHACRMPYNNLQLPLTEKCIADQLKPVGYQTGYIGKWHMDGEPRPGFVPPGPRRRGYEYWAAFNRGHFYFESTYYRDENQPVHVDGFEPDYQTGLAVDFIRRNKDNPFYLYLSWGPPHTPRTPPDKYRNYYKTGQFRLPPNVPASYEAEARKDRVGYYGLCTALDDNVGRLLKTLDETGIADDTIAVFTTDHGDMLGSQGLEYKGVPYEESARIPFLLRYPRKLRGGQNNDLLMCNVDYMPTLLSMCGVKSPAAVQGRDLSGQILTGQGPRPDSVFAYGRLLTKGEWRMVVRGNDKFVTDAAGKVTHLFDLKNDPYETRNLAADGGQTKKRAELETLTAGWLKRIGYTGKIPGLTGPAPGENSAE